MIIGEETGGSTGAPLVVEIPGGSNARICALRIKYPYSGKLFVNKGVSPDIEVRNTLDDDLKNRDKVLETALDILSK